MWILQERIHTGYSYLTNKMQHCKVVDKQSNGPLLLVLPPKFYPWTIIVSTGFKCLNIRMLKSEKCRRFFSFGKSFQAQNISQVNCYNCTFALFSALDSFLVINKCYFDFSDVLATLMIFDHFSEI